MGDDDGERPATSSIEIQVYRPTTVGGSYTQLPRDLDDGEYVEEGENEKESCGTAGSCGRRGTEPA